MATQLEIYERFLRFGELKNTTELMRARAVYIVGWAFVFTQLVNIVLMTATYGGWTWDHTVSAVGISMVILLIHSLRFTKSFPFFTAVYILFLLMGIAASALPDKTGIDSAVLPLLVAGCFLAGFIGGWQMALFYCGSAIAFVWGLHSISFSVIASDPVALAALEARIFQRAAQTSLALVLATTFSVFITIAMNQLFVKLEELVDIIKKSDQEKTEFVANLSHELRTPLNGVVGMTKLLRETPMRADQRKYSKILERCGHRLNQIVSDAIDLASLDAGTFELEEKSFNFKALVKELIETYKPAANLKGLHLDQTFAAQLPEYYVGDARRMRKVLRSLVLNALKFTEKGSVHLYVDGRLKGANSVVLHISIIDTGVSLSSEDFRKIFKRFRQMEQGLNRKNSGTGLGLAISKEFISFMGGTIKVESNAGEGAKFEILLPLRVGEAEPELETSDAVILPSSSYAA